MSSEKQNIDQLFKQKLENFELSSQGSSWKMLQYVKNEKIRVRKLVLARRIVIAFISLLTVLSIFFLSKDYSYKNSKNQQVENSNIEKQSGSSKFDVKLIKDRQNTSQTFAGTLSAREKKIAFSEEYFYASEDLIANNFLISVSSTQSAPLSQIKKENLVKTNEVSFNSSFDEYAPVLSKDGSFMFFTSRRPISNKEIRKGEGRERIYYTECNESGWSEAKLLESPINTANNFNSAVALSPDGKSLFIYRDDRQGNGDLFVSHLSGFKWSTPEVLPPPINTKFHESSLTISADGNTLYFTSNRDGGVGGMDIWFTQKDKNGKWGDAVNIGNAVNTDKDEEGIFLHPDGKTLYFSSRGHKGLGGYDIFYTKLENGKWSKPINLGSDVNTENDDVYFVLKSNSDDAFYTSVNANNPHQKDIFKINFKQGDYQKSVLKQASLLKGVVLEKSTKKSISADIDVYDDLDNKLIASLKSDATNGEFSFPLSPGKTYRVHFYKEGFLNFSESIYVSSAENQHVIIKKVFLDELSPDHRILLKQIVVSENENKVDSSIIVKLDELYQLMVLNPTLKIQLQFEMNSNKESIVHLHQNQINKYMDYIKSKGISKHRIEGKLIPASNKTESKHKTNLIAYIQTI